MPKVEKKKKEVAGATVDGKEVKTEIVKVDPKTSLDKSTGKQVINFKNMEPGLRDKVAALYEGLQKAFTDMRVGFMTIGQYLTEAEMLLKPRGLFTPFLNAFPNFKQAQAYRYILGYTIAQRHYPPAVLDAILATGAQMIGTKDRPYGKYQEVVKKLPPPKDADTTKATAWLNEIEQSYKDSRKKENRVRDNDSMQKEAFKSIVKKLSQVDDKKKLKWMRSLFGYVIANMGMTQPETITPLDPPADWVQKKGQAESANEDDE